MNSIEGKCVAAAFLNAYTFALSEIIGRNYGEDALTFEPEAMRRTRVPTKMANQLILSKIDRWQWQGEIDKILDYTDSVLLQNALGLTEQEAYLLRSIWDKKCGRRMTRKVSAT